MLFYCRRCHVLLFDIFFISKNFNWDLYFWKGLISLNGEIGDIDCARNYETHCRFFIEFTITSHFRDATCVRTHQSSDSKSLLSNLGRMARERVGDS
jgi:hypothetical protein